LPNLAVVVSDHQLASILRLAKAAAASFAQSTASTPQAPALVASHSSGYT